MPHRYHINLFWSDEAGCWIADVPDLTWRSAHGPTPEAALAEVGSATSPAPPVVWPYRPAGRRDPGAVRLAHAPVATAVGRCSWPVVGLSGPTAAPPGSAAQRRGQPLPTRHQARAATLARRPSGLARGGAAESRCGPRSIWQARWSLGAIRRSPPSMNTCVPTARPRSSPSPPACASFWSSSTPCSPTRHHGGTDSLLDRPRQLLTLFLCWPWC